MAHIEMLLQYLLPLQQSGVTKFIAICGAADLGKSTLARQLLEQLKERQLTADILSMDSYLIPRQKRNALSISGYDAQAYEWDRLINDVRLLQLGTSIQIQEYDHASGTAGGPLKQIKPDSLVLIDGLHSMHQNLISYVDFSVFIHTSDEHLKQLRRRADTTKRGLSEAAALRNESKEFERYKKHIAPYAKDAELLLNLNENWEYTLSFQSS